MFVTLEEPVCFYFIFSDHLCYHGTQNSPHPTVIGRSKHTGYSKLIAVMNLPIYCLRFQLHVYFLIS